MPILYCTSCYLLAVKRWGFYRIWFLSCFLTPGKVFIKITNSWPINLENDRSFSWDCLPLYSISCGQFTHRGVKKSVAPCVTEIICYCTIKQLTLFAPPSTYIFEIRECNGQFSAYVFSSPITLSPSTSALIFKLKFLVPFLFSWIIQKKIPYLTNTRPSPGIKSFVLSQLLKTPLFIN